MLRLQNVLIVVNDMERAVGFYRDVFGMDVILYNEGNVILTGGPVLQDMECWKELLGTDCIPKNNHSELYFTHTDPEAFIQKLESSGCPFEYVNTLTTDPGGRKMIRFYDPDGNLIEVGTPA